MGDGFVSDRCHRFQFHRHNQFNWAYFSKSLTKKRSCFSLKNLDTSSIYNRFIKHCFQRLNLNSIARKFATMKNTTERTNRFSRCARGTNPFCSRTFAFIPVCRPTHLRQDGRKSERGEGWKTRGHSPTTCNVCFSRLHTSEYAKNDCVAGNRVYDAFCICTDNNDHMGFYLC